MSRPVVSGLCCGFSAAGYGIMCGMKNTIKTLSSCAALAFLSLATGCMSASVPASGESPDMAQKYAASLERIDAMRDTLAKKDAEIADYAKKFHDLSAKFVSLAKQYQSMSEQYDAQAKSFQDLSRRYDAMSSRFQDQERRFNALAKSRQDEESETVNALNEISAKLKALNGRAASLTNKCGRTKCGKASISD